MNKTTTHSSYSKLFADVPKLNDDLLVHCMRCGLCLPSCPTFSIYHVETASPRGRLALMNAINKNKLEISNGFVDAMNLCLGCLACQTTCPAGVQFGHLLEASRAQSEEYQCKHRNPILNIVRRWLLTRLLDKPRHLERLMLVLRIYQRLGLKKLNLARFAPGPFGKWEQMLPWVDRKSANQELGELLPAVPPKRGRIGLLTGCIENSLLAGMCTATAKVLARNGFDVVIPPDQECCGALPAHMGEIEIARQRARNNIDHFEAANVDYIISDAAGCSAQLKDYKYLLADDPEYKERAEHFSHIARDLTEFLADFLPLRPGMQHLNMRVAFDDPCQLIHAQGVSVQPRALLTSIPGIELLELPESSWCCGSAGIYNLTHPKEADILLERKIENLQKISVDILVTANSGCYLQLAAGVRRFKVDVEVMHLSELLAKAYFC